MEEFSKPILVEPGVKYFLGETLKQCKVFKDKHKNTMFNISMFFIFLGLLGGLLVYKYKGKLTDSEREEKDMEKKQYILSKIRNFQDAKLRAHQNLITGLPQWENEFDIINKKINI